MRYQLLLEAPRPTPPQTILLQPGVFLLGSTVSPEEGHILSHPLVSGHHAQLDVTEDGVTLMDLGSLNGTAVNQYLIPPHQPAPLQLGNTILIGVFELTLQRAPEKAERKEVEETAVFETSDDPLPNTSHNDPEIDQKLPTLQETQCTTGGLERDFSHYIQYLPAIYDVPFMHHFLAMLESLLQPIVWRIDGREQLLDPRTTPTNFLPWLANWYGLTFDRTWAVSQQQALLKAAPFIYQWWGTAKALRTVLEIYTGQDVLIIDDDPLLPPHEFRVEILAPLNQNTYKNCQRLINAHKPAHCTYTLHFTRKA